MKLKKAILVSQSPQIGSKTKQASKFSDSLAGATNKFVGQVFHIYAIQAMD
jgi:hypothetical protein